jgi:hypothetical protein
MAAKPDNAKQGHGGARRGSGRRRTREGLYQHVALQEETYKKWTALQENLQTSSSDALARILISAFENCKVEEQAMQYA